MLWMHSCQNSTKEIMKRDKNKIIRKWNDNSNIASNDVNGHSFRSLLKLRIINSFKLWKKIKKKKFSNVFVHQNDKWNNRRIWKKSLPCLILPGTDDLLHPNNVEWNRDDVGLKILSRDSPLHGTNNMSGKNRVKKTNFLRTWALSTAAIKLEV